MNLRGLIPHYNRPVLLYYHVFKLNTNTCLQECGKTLKSNAIKKQFLKNMFFKQDHRLRAVDD
jgi:hypothetical protein